MLGLRIAVLSGELGRHLHKSLHDRAHSPSDDALGADWKLLASPRPVQSPRTPARIAEELAILARASVISRSPVGDSLRFSN